LPALRPALLQCLVQWLVAPYDPVELTIADTTQKKWLVAPYDPVELTIADHPVQHKKVTDFFQHQIQGI
jgi:hypothetical protein